MYIGSEYAVQTSLGSVKNELQFFLTRRELPEGKTAGNHNSYAYENVSGISGAVISRHLATLHELETIYSYEDMLDMYEIVYINNLNEQLLAEDAQK